MLYLINDLCESLIKNTLCAIKNMANPPFSLEDIDLLTPQYISDILTFNNYLSTTPLANKLSATILLHNGHFLIENDQKYVANNAFKFLYLCTDLKQMAKDINIKITPNMNRIDTIRKMIDIINEYDQCQKDTLLVKSAEDGNKEMVQIALNIGADVHLETIVGKDASLLVAAEFGHTEIVRLLLDRGADVHAPSPTPIPTGYEDEDDYENIPPWLPDYALRMAAQNGHTKTVELLLDKEADIHALDDYALRFASGGGHIETVKLLVKNGAEIYTRNDDSVLTIAADNGHTEIVIFLLENGADIHANDDQTLRFVVKYNNLIRDNTEMIKLLLEKGANLSALSPELQIKYKHLLP